MKTVWIPESPSNKGLYANESDDSQGLDPQRTTTFLGRAKQFPTKEACCEWCDANPSPVFVPTEHQVNE